MNKSNVLFYIQQLTGILFICSAHHSSHANKLNGYL